MVCVRACVLWWAEDTTGLGTKKKVVFTLKESFGFFFSLYLFVIWCFFVFFSGSPLLLMIHWGSAEALVAMQLVVLWSWNIPEQQRVEVFIRTLSLKWSLPTRDWPLCGWCWSGAYSFIYKDIVDFGGGKDSVHLLWWMWLRCLRPL